MKTLFTLLSVFIFSTAFAQHTEFRVALNSGLFHYSGASAESSTSIYETDIENGGSTQNPFGSKNGLCYGLSLNVKRMASKHFFYGVDVGLESLRSKILIDTVIVSSYDMRVANVYAAEGRTFYKLSFFNLNPFIGYRFVVKNVDCDLAGGFDIGYCFNNIEKGKATASNGTEYQTSNERSTIDLDIRPRIQIGADYKRFGGYLGYSTGLKSYKGNYAYIGGVSEAYARLFRFGLTYRLD